MSRALVALALAGDVATELQKTPEATVGICFEFLLAEAEVLLDALDGQGANYSIAGALVARLSALDGFLDKHVDMAWRETAESEAAL